MTCDGCFIRKQHKSYTITVHVLHIGMGCYFFYCRFLQLRNIMRMFYQRECFTPDCFRLQDGKKMCMQCENYTNVKSLRIACMRTV